MTEPTEPLRTATERLTDFVTSWGDKHPLKIECSPLMIEDFKRVLAAVPELDRLRAELAAVEEQRESVKVALDGALADRNTLGAQLISTNADVEQFRRERDEARAELASLRELGGATYANLKEMAAERDRLRSALAGEAPRLIEMLRRDLDAETDAADPENPPVPARRSGYFSGVERCIALLEEAVPAEDTPEPADGEHAWRFGRCGQCGLTPEVLNGDDCQPGLTDWVTMTRKPAPEPTAEAEPAAWVPKVNDRVQHPGEDDWIDAVVAKVSDKHPEALLYHEETEMSRWVMFEDMRPADAPARPDLTGLAMEEDTEPSEGPTAEAERAGESWDWLGELDSEFDDNEMPDSAPTVRDRDGDVWTYDAASGTYRTEGLESLPWRNLLWKYGPLTEVPDNPGSAVSEGE